MKSKMIVYMTKAKLFAAVLLAACLFGSAANAQSDFQGKFTLPFEARWGKAVLPPGDYVFTFTNDNMQPMLVIREAKSRLAVAYELLDIREGTTKSESALLIGTRGTQRIVYSLTIAERGESFVYERPSTGGRAGHEVRKLQAVPVIVAKK